MEETTLSTACGSCSNDKGNIIIFVLNDDRKHSARCGYSDYYTPPAIRELSNEVAVEDLLNLRPGNTMSRDVRDIARVPSKLSVFVHRGIV